MRLKAKLYTTFIINILLALLVIMPVIAATAGELIIHHAQAEVNDDQETYTVKVTLSVLDNDNQVMEDLAARDFIVTEDSVPVEVEQVAISHDYPISVIVVMDTSGSMQGTRLTTAKNAIAGFIKNLYRDDKVAVYTFNHEVKELVSLTDDLNNARDAFEGANIVASGGTCLFDATYQAVQQAKAVAGDRQAVVILSDGRDEYNSTTCSSSTVEDIIDLATEDEPRIPVYAIGVGNQLDEDSLETLAVETGGLFRKTDQDSDLPAFFEGLANRLASEYTLTYQSENAPGQHDLEIQVDDAKASFELMLPGLPPILTITQPEADEALEPKVNEIVVIPSERGIPVEAISFKINGVTIGVVEEVGTPPYEYEIDFSQYAGQDVELTVVALDKDGKEIADTSLSIALTEEVTATATPNPDDDDTDDDTNTSSTCPDDKICIGNLQIAKNQLILVGGIALGVIFIVVMLIVLLSKKKKDKAPKAEKKESLFEDATIDGFSLPGALFGRLTMLSSDDPLLVGKEFQLLKSPTTIGRSVSNDIALPKDSAVSRQHLEIVDEHGKAVLHEVMKTLSDGTKQPPTYGTYINDRKVTGPTSLNTGDEISLGRRTKLRFEGTGQQPPMPEGGSEDVTMDQISLQGFDEMNDATRDG